jgi:hypothetical protein
MRTSMPKWMGLAFVLLAGGAARAASVDFACLPDPGEGRIVGIPPLSVHCEVLPPPSGTWSAVSWTLGDGTLLFGDTIAYEYVEPGQYNVSVQLDDFDDGTEAPTDPRRTEYGYVTVCDEPAPEFTFVNHGELDYEVVNLTPITFGCTEAQRWELFRGRPDGDPERVWETWEPRFELGDEGEYTLRLTVDGLAGTAAAELRFDAEHKLTEDLTNGPHAMACAIGSGGSAGWLGLGLLAAVGRRRGRRG